VRRYSENSTANITKENLEPIFWRMMLILRIKILIVLTILCSISIKGYGQTSGILEMEQNTISIYKKLNDNSYPKNRDSLISNLNVRLPELLKLSEACNFNFDSLRKYIYIVSSQDHLVRIFSWDDLTGGTYHFFNNYLQFTPDGSSCKTLPLDESDESPEVAYTSIESLVNKNRTYYFFFGSGTSGGGEKHEIFRIFEIANDSLAECIKCYPSGKFLTIHSARSQKIDLRLDLEKSEITYNQYYLDPEYGGYSSKFSKITYAFVNGKLVLKK
jgi:hypothetical protein